MYKILKWCLDKLDKNELNKKGLFYIVITLIVLSLIPFLIFLTLPILCALVIYRIKTELFYRTKGFIKLKNKLNEKIQEFNDFNSFTAETRVYIGKKQRELTFSNVRESTLTVYKNSKLDMYKYIVKYFFNNKKIDEESLQIIEEILQKYSTLEQTNNILRDEFKLLTRIIDRYMYKGAYLFKARTMKKLGYQKVPKFKKDYYIYYAFDYHTPANHKEYRNLIILDESKLEDFAKYLNSLIKYRKTAKYQRQLMTPKLRRKILDRDNFTCQKCGVSSKTERHLLLEIDHIMPIAKGGITIENNLQALCWKCNRAKGTKTTNEVKIIRKTI